MNLSEIEIAIFHEINKRNIVGEKKDKYIDNIIDSIVLDIPKYMEEVINNEFVNKGRLESGWIIEYQNKGWMVIFVNESRCRIQNLAESSEELDISAYSNVKVLFKPEVETETENLNENKDD